jgi:IS605 OrfB family transposase
VNYFDGKSGKRQGTKVAFPRYKSKKRAQQSFRLNNDKFWVAGHTIHIPKLGRVNMTEPLRFPGKILGAVVSRAADCRWWRAKRKLERFHPAIVNKRADMHHQASHAIASTYALIGVEDLHIKGIVKSRRLALPLSEVGPGQFLRQIEYKATAYGGRVVQVGRFYASSKSCNACGLHQPGPRAV